jgi:aminomethyltransferase
VGHPWIGFDAIIEQLTKGGPGPKRRRVGMIVSGAPARAEAKIFDESGANEIGALDFRACEDGSFGFSGAVTSGIPSPTLGQNIAMGYVQSGHHKVGTPLQVMVRNKLREATVVKMPFVPVKYYRPAK